MYPKVLSRSLQEVFNKKVFLEKCPCVLDWIPGFSVEIRAKVFCKKSVLKSFSKFKEKHYGSRPSTRNFVNKDTTAKVFSCKFCKNLKKTFLHNTSVQLFND